ncbi:helix-turn-helix domain-containing protein [Nocardia tengchongensis]|uniref:Helix-turn-helix domain-containing protein n=1 Tax=Nocardia tengchongensis TaxID=2055889 RepID=A0ABX8CKB5_9NOCA|nr:helix-turn-helix transcriptional regulator [Nocardia tengchongensis]QVI20411.1 helix-turn-helix domain-containing protein [Nocardia tengchongensis]
MAGSTLPRRALGRTLRNFRLRAGKGQFVSARHVDMSPQCISRMEDGQRVKISTAQIRELLEFYGIANPSQERDDLLGLWDEVKQQDQVSRAMGTSKGWWRSYSDQFTPHFDHYLNLEAASNHLTTHQLVMVHGLLQTPEYRRSLIKATHPDLSNVDVERRLELAARRQERLDDKNFRLDAILSEATLKHRPGGLTVMVDQLQHLADMGSRDNVSVRVVPFAVGTHAGLALQSFGLLEFPPFANHLKEPPVVYVEGSVGALYLDQEQVITRFQRAITDLQRVALSEDDTRELLSATAKEYAK